jgi:hypothetical protein
MRSIGLSALCCALTSAFAHPSLAAPNETAVCVEVVMKRPKTENRVNSNKSHARPVASNSNAESSDKPAESNKPDETEVKPGAVPKVGVAQPDTGASVDAVSNGTSGSAAEAELTPPAVESATAADLPGDLRVESGALLPLGQTPKVYLKRLLEHFVTHERGFVATSEGCTQRIVVELYPLQVGWAAFARYTGTGREERVDQLLPTELSQFAERASLALLHDVTIGETVDRDNVLLSDSLHSTQRIRGRNHFVLGLGTRLRGGYFDTVVTDATKANYGGVERSLRLFSPMAVMTGYRGVFDQFGVEALAQFDVGTSQVAAKNNPAGGHVDYAGSLGLVLHVTRYADPRGIASLYYGGGATFELVWFNAIVPDIQRTGDSRSTLMGGGLNADAVIGYEFMRASAVSLFLQGELNLPAYMLKNQNDAASLNTWFPGMKLALGANF